MQGMLRPQINRNGGMSVTGNGPCLKKARKYQVSQERKRAAEAAEMARDREARETISNYDEIKSMKVRIP